jgi:fumarate reductase flavoprotein subunit
MVALTAPDKWDHETEILIIGAGTAGLPCAIVAAEAGAKVTILESMMTCGGSGSLIAAGAGFAGTEFQKKAGVRDSPDNLYKDGVKAGGIPELWRVFADNQVDTYKWLTCLGIKPWTDELAMPPGHTVERLHWYRGAAAMKRIEERARELLNIQILLQHRARRLVRNPQTGRILGAEVEKSNKTLYFRGLKAVVLTTGGFGRNREMLKEYGERYVDCIPNMAPGLFGDGLKMALDMGAATKYIGHAVVGSLPVCDTTRTDKGHYIVCWGGIVVNLNGKRFYNEACTGNYYGMLYDAALDEPEGQSIIVYDSRIRQHPVALDSALASKEYVADTLEKLAATTGIRDPAAFVATVQKYNEDIESEGYDTVLGRKYQQSIYGTPLTLGSPPYYAIKCHTSLTSMKGGLKINTRCQVIDNYGDVIPGLYAVGEVTGGLVGKGTYLGGLMWPASMTFGRLVGRAVAFEQIEE